MESLTVIILGLIIIEAGSIMSFFDLNNTNIYKSKKGYKRLPDYACVASFVSGLGRRDKYS